MNIVIFAVLAALNFSHADATFISGTDFQACRKELLEMLPVAEDSKSKSQVLWRLARVQLMLGEKETTKEGRRTVFAEGVKYGEQAIAASPKDPDCYMWHSACVGRECQTHSLKDQAQAVPVMMRDLSMILETMGRTDYSAAWQALAEIYWNHPFKSNDEAINFTRKAISTIPSGELRLSAYILLAQMLIKRDAGPSKRTSIIKSNASKTVKGNIGKFSCYDGILGPGFKPVWSSKSISELSDAEEAEAILKYAENIYIKRNNKTVIDRTDYRTIQSLLKKL